MLYYYLSKKTENYRQLLRKSRARPRTRNQNTQNNNNTNNSANNQVQTVVKPENNGVTTRQQKEQKTEPQTVSSSVPCSQGNGNNASDGLLTTSASPTIVMPAINDENVDNNNQPVLSPPAK